MAKKKKDRLSPDAAAAAGTKDYPLPQAEAPRALPVDKCRWSVDHTKLGFKTTKEVRPLRTIVGQPRALAALKLGTELRARGYNIYASGISATGRSTAVKAILEGFRIRGREYQDRCYVNNFKSPDQPRLITLPRGSGRVFKSEMGQLVENLRNTIPHALDGETVLASKRELAEIYAKREAKLFQGLEKKVVKDGFALVQVQMGPYTRPDIFPIIDGKPVPPNQVGKLVEEGKFPKSKLDGLYHRYQGFKADLRAVLKRARQLNRELAEKTANIEREVLKEILSDLCQDMCDKFPEPKILEYICEVQEFILETPGIFSSEEDEHQREGIPAPTPVLGPADETRMGDPFRLFQVNVVRDGAAEDPCPVIIEHHPTYLNLFGTVEREWRLGGYWTSDFTLIKCGSLLRADGGFLVLNALDVLMEPHAWRTLMRTLKTCKLQIQGLDTLLSISPTSLTPEPIEVDVTVILIGDSYLYHMLTYYEEDFQRIFKVRADFDTLMPRGRPQIRHYAALASKMAADEGTKHLSAKAVARLAEEGARLGSRGGKMSARFGEIADILREANHHAGVANAKVIEPVHVKEAVLGREYRQDLIRERIGEAIDEGILMIDTRGKVVGQVNGLAVHDIGTFAFGRPTRITCEISIGESGVVNIEREAKLSGKIHDKGVLIMDGYLRHLYGTDGPITLSASLCFEQSYSEVDGDSASLAEVLVLISELSELPLRQDLAVTGSINQKGQVQAIGGINEKIEGYFRVCKADGLTDTQGVVMPRANVPELMLPEEILKAIGKGKFSIIPVSTVNQAIDAFTGVKAGRRLKKGGWTKGSVHDRVDITLADFYWATKKAEKAEEGAEDEEKAVKPDRKRKPRRKKGSDSDDLTDTRDAINSRHRFRGERRKR